MTKIRLESNDGEIIPVEVDIAKEMVTIKTMLEDLGINEEAEDENDVVPLPNVDSNVLKKIIEWAEHHKKHPVVIKEQRDWTGLDWDKDQFLAPVCQNLLHFKATFFSYKKTLFLIF